MREKKRVWRCHNYFPVPTMFVQNHTLLFRISHHLIRIPPPARPSRGYSIAPCACVCLSRERESFFSSIWYLYVSVQWSIDVDNVRVPVTWRGTASAIRPRLKEICLNVNGTHVINFRRPSVCVRVLVDVFHHILEHTRSSVHWLPLFRLRRDVSVWH